MTEIGDIAFLGCKSLTEVNLPDSLTSIGESAFRGCTSVEKIYIPDNDKILVSLKYFSDCPDTAKIFSSKFGDSIGVKTLADFRNLTEINFPEGLTKISRNVFRGCKILTEINLPDGLTKIAKNAFSGCTGLKKITYSRKIVLHLKKIFRDKWNELEKIVSD